MCGLLWSRWALAVVVDGAAVDDAPVSDAVVVDITDVVDAALVVAVVVVGRIFGSKMWHHGDQVFCDDKTHMCHTYQHIRDVIY